MISKFILSKSFKKNPIKTLFRCFYLIILLLLGSKKIIKINFGKKFFLFLFYPLGKGTGSRGIFLFRERYEPLLEYGHKFILPTDTIIDGGANQGIFSLAFASLSKKIKIFSVEPFKYCHKILKENLKINLFKNVTIIPKVLSNTIASHQLDYSKSNVSASIVRDFGGEKTLTISSTTIDEITLKYKLQKIDLIKLDIEGAELAALKGGSRSIQKFIPKIVLECNNYEYKKICKFLKKFKYTSYLLTKDGFIKKINSIPKSESNIFFLTKEHIHLLKIL
jgi:FkbM family methyltransferase